MARYWSLLSSNWWIAVYCIHEKHENGGSPQNPQHILFFFECTQIICALKLATQYTKSWQKSLLNVYFEYFPRTPICTQTLTQPENHLQILYWKKANGTVQHQPTNYISSNCCTFWDTAYFVQWSPKLNILPSQTFNSNWTKFLLACTILHPACRWLVSVAHILVDQNWATFNMVQPPYITWKEMRRIWRRWWRTQKLTLLKVKQPLHPVLLIVQQYSSQLNFTHHGLRLKPWFIHHLLTGCLGKSNCLSQECVWATMAISFLIKQICVLFWLSWNNTKLFAAPCHQSTNKNILQCSRGKQGPHENCSWLW